MIPKGLKVGQTYLEGDMVYEVVKVLGDGRYEGRWTGATPSKPLSAEEPKEEELKPFSDYETMQYAQLKKLCAERGLDATGKKSDLIARLEG